MTGAGGWITGGLRLIEGAGLRAVWAICGLVAWIGLGIGDLGRAGQKAIDRRIRDRGL